MQTFSIWLKAIRPKTLMAAFAPIVIALFCALAKGAFNPFIALFTLLAGLGIQICTNLANDYFDFIQGKDTACRKGPVRVCQSGLVTTLQMRGALFVATTLTSICASLLILKGGLPIALLSGLSLLLAFGYTTGPYPLSYTGLGDLFVLIFFGPVATLGTYFLQVGALSWEVALLGLGTGLLSTAILVVNNLRDIEEDSLTGKKTTCVRFGKKFGKIEYTLLVLLAPLPPLLARYFLPLALLLPATFLVWQLWKEETDLNPFLGKTSLLLGLYTLLCSLELFSCA